MASTFDGVIDEQVFERDGWLCQMPACLNPAGLHIDRELAWPDPLSASVDHIIPFSRGGTDVAVNKRAAHLVCNTSRGNRIGPEDVQVVTPELAPLGVLPPLRVPKLKTPCAACGKPLGRWNTSGTCGECRAAASDALRLQVLAARAAGMTWAEVAEACGLSGPGAAHNVAYSDPSGAPSPAYARTQPDPELEKRLWWTSVRPV